MTTQSGTINVAGALGVTWEDYDNDGNLDLYIVNSQGQSQPNRLFRNNGDGTFTDVASASRGRSQDSRETEGALMPPLLIITMMDFRIFLSAMERVIQSGLTFSFGIMGTATGGLK